MYGEVDWTNADLFITGKHRKKPLKTFCFVFLNGCVLIARDSSDIKSQVSSYCCSSIENFNFNGRPTLMMAKTRTSVLIDSFGLFPLMSSTLNLSIVTTNTNNAGD